MVCGGVERALTLGGIVDDQSKVALSILAGAVLGGLVGFFYLTTQGRDLKSRIEPALDDVLDEVRRWRGTAAKARVAAEESMRSFAEFVEAPSPRWPQAVESKSSRS
jgi:hypothetical protein